jgi:hypothetical protein
MRIDVFDKDLTIIDDAFSPTIYADIKNIVYSDWFPWKYSPTTSSTVAGDGYSFSELLYLNSELTESPMMGAPRKSEISHRVEIAFLTVLDKLDVKFKDLLRIRVGLLPHSPIVFDNGPHIDMRQKHMTALMYFTTCNAPTTIFKEQFDTNYSETHSTDTYYKEVLNKNLSVKHKIDAVENRMVLFNGHNYHCSSRPSDVDIRIAINFNFTTYD